jgi:hypothetical protein
VDGLCSSYHPRGEADICAGSLGRERTGRMIDIPYEAFLKIAGGREVKVRLQSSEIELTQGRVELLRRLAGRMMPGRGRDVIDAPERRLTMTRQRTRA